MDVQMEGLRLSSIFKSILLRPTHSLPTVSIELGRPHLFTYIPIKKMLKEEICHLRLSGCLVLALVLSVLVSVSPSVPLLLLLPVAALATAPVPLSAAAPAPPAAAAATSFAALGAPTAAAAALTARPPVARVRPGRDDRRNMEEEMTES